MYLGSLLGFYSSTVRSSKFLNCSPEMGCSSFHNLQFTRQCSSWGPDFASPLTSECGYVNTPLITYEMRNWEKKRWFRSRYTFLHLFSPKATWTKESNDLTDLKLEIICPSIFKWNTASNETQTCVLIHYLRDIFFFNFKSMKSDMCDTIQTKMWLVNQTLF